MRPTVEGLLRKTPIKDANNGQKLWVDISDLRMTVDGKVVVLATARLSKLRSNEISRAQLIFESGDTIFLVASTLLEEDLKTLLVVEDGYLPIERVV